VRKDIGGARPSIESFLPEGVVNNPFHPESALPTQFYQLHAHLPRYSVELEYSLELIGE
jgi:hypothetical protein